MRGRPNMPAWPAGQIFLRGLLGLFGSHGARIFKISNLGGSWSQPRKFAVRARRFAEPRGCAADF